MAEVLRSPSSSSPPSISAATHNAALFHQSQSYVDDEAVSGLIGDGGDIGEEDNRARDKSEKERRDQLSLLAILLALFRKSFWLACRTDERADFSCGGTSVGSGCGNEVMEIGWPTDVQHVNHVTFDRFNGFLGLPVEFEPEVSRRAPSASATVFGVSTESMQLSYDARGNSIPTILLLMQRHLYSQGGLQAEGIFRITAGNSQEEFVRDQLNRGLVPNGIDVHCLAGLIKAWFRELPRGVLDSLSSEQVMQCNSEEDCELLVGLLPSTEAALLDWAINLMADVVQEEYLNKMNARNIAMVFAPNMTQMADPLTALIYAVQVMNFLKMLIEKTIRERGDPPAMEPAPMPHMEPSDDNGHQSSALVLHQDNPPEQNELTIQAFLAEDPGSYSDSEANQLDDATDDGYVSYSVSADESEDNTWSKSPEQVEKVLCAGEAGTVKGLLNQFEENNISKTDWRSGSERGVDPYKSRGISNLSRINSIIERFESWR